MRSLMFVLVAGLAFPSADTRADDPPKGAKPVPSKPGRDKEVEALKQEIEALRQKVEALGKKEEPRPQSHLIVVTSPQVKDVDIPQRYAGQVYAQRHIEIRALVTGVITDVLVKEGQAVRKGDELFRVSSVVYKAKLDAERADARVAEVEFLNTKKLFEQKLLSSQELALHDAKLAKAQARVKLAEAELNFTTVRAPFDGLLGRLQEREGSVVKAGDSVVTTLSDNSVVWVYFAVPEARYLEFKTLLGKSGSQSRLELADSRVELLLADGHPFDQRTGNTVTVEAEFNDKTGNISFRADFPNPEGLLRHGQTGTVVVHRPLKNALVIPQRATFEVLDRRYVYVVGKDNVARRREIVVRNEVDSIFVVKKGLEATDRIVVDGVRGVRDGEKVEFEFRKPEEVLAEPKKHVE